MLSPSRHNFAHRTHVVSAPRRERTKDARVLSPRVWRTHTTSRESHAAGRTEISTLVRANLFSREALRESPSLAELGCEFARMPIMPDAASTAEAKRRLATPVEFVKGVGPSRAILLE